MGTTKYRDAFSKLISEIPNAWLFSDSENYELVKEACKTADRYTVTDKDLQELAELAARKKREVKIICERNFKTSNSEANNR